MPLLKQMGKQLSHEKATGLTGDKIVTTLLHQLMQKYASGFGSIKSVKDLDRYVGYEQYAAKKAKALAGKK